MKSGASYPVLKPSYEDAYWDDHQITYYDGTDNTADLTQYIYKVLDENYADFSGDLFSIVTNADVTPQTWSGDNWEYTSGAAKPLASLSGIGNRNLTLAPDAPVGDYTLTFKVSNTADGYDDKTFDLKIRKKTAVPKPEVKDGYSDKPYDPAQTLDDIKITDGWKWTDLTQVPKPNDSSLKTFTYKVFYPFSPTVPDGEGGTVTIDSTNFTDYYDLTKVSGYTYEEIEGVPGVWVMLDPTVEHTDTSPVKAHIIVKDADTDLPVNGATVSCVTADSETGERPFPDELPDGSVNADGFEEDTTHNDATYGDGYVYAELAKGNYHDIKVTVASGDYADKTEQIYIYNADDTYYIYITPTRVDFTIPEVHLASDPATKIDPAQVTVTKMSGDTGAWVDADGNAIMSVRGNSGDTVKIPKGTSSNPVVYKLVSSTYSYTTGDVLYMRIEYDSTLDAYVPKYYTDLSCTAAAGRDYLLADEMTEPVYIVTIDRDTTVSPTKYTAKLDLKNIKATYGTFGIKYDKDALKYLNYTISSAHPAITLTSVEDCYDDPFSPGSYPHGAFDTDNGYFEFIWHADDTTDGVLDTETSQEEIVTLNFELKPGVTDEEVSVDWFNIEKWGDTKAAQNFVTANPDEAAVIDEQRFRPVDSLNNPGSLGQGRIEKSKAVVNDIDTKGFFQASVNADPTDTTTGAYFYDVMVNIQYAFPIENSLIRFHVYDDDGGSPDLENASVDLYDKSPALCDTKLTNVAGIAKFIVNTSSGASGYDFDYAVACTGYWPVKLGDRPQINAPTGTVTNVDVPMEKKIYHQPVILPTGDVTLNLVQDADLGGEKYAYNGRDFHFRCKAAKGYRITQYPTKAKVYIVDHTGTRVVELNVDPAVTADPDHNWLTPDLRGIFTLPASFLNQETLQSLTSGEYADIAANDPYYAVSGYDALQPTAPTVDGFRSYNVYIEFDDFVTKQISYTVEGVINDTTMGTVTYNDTIPTYSGATLTEDGASTADRKFVKTQNDDTATTGVDESNYRTGTFEFKANPGYVIDKVFINGLRTMIYDGLDEFTYSFGEVDMDCNITVLYAPEGASSADSMITLVVGDYGSVDVSAPTAETEVSITRRVYLNPSGGITFTTKPMNGYRLHAVEKEIAKANQPNAITNITSSGTAGDPNEYTFTVLPEPGENVVVYVTFENDTITETPSLFVKSYVYEGMGVVNPAGILVYNIYDTVEVELSALPPYTPKGVVLQPFDDLTAITSTEPLVAGTNKYVHLSLTNSIAIGAQFEEPSEEIKGIVDLSQGSTVTTAPCLTGATVTFRRLLGDGLDEKASQPLYKFTTTNSRTGAVFTANIPLGYWNVYVEKPGYVTYVIKNFHMTGAGCFGGDLDSDGVPDHPIVPYIGSTTNGKMINLIDAANVKSGWRYGVNATIKNMADVDNDGNVLNLDLIYVWANFNQRLVSQPYTDFEANGSVYITHTAP